MQIALIDTIEMMVTEAAHALPSRGPHLFYDDKRVTMVCSRVLSCAGQVTALAFVKLGS